MVSMTDTITLTNAERMELRDGRDDEEQRIGRVHRTASDEIGQVPEHRAVNSPRE
jgi:hypothetical protein